MASIRDARVQTDLEVDGVDTSEPDPLPGGRPSGKGARRVDGTSLRDLPLGRHVPFSAELRELYADSGDFDG